MMAPLTAWHRFLRPNKFTAYERIDANLTVATYNIIVIAVMYVFMLGLMIWRAVR